MPNRNYEKGRRKEYKLINQLIDGSFVAKEGEEAFSCPIAQRTAGSHSPFDIIAVHPERKIIMLIQSKPDTMSEKEIEKIKEENKKLNGLYFVRFLVK